MPTLKAGNSFTAREVRAAQALLAANGAVVPWEQISGMPKHLRLKAIPRARSLIARLRRVTGLNIVLVPGYGFKVARR